MDPPHKELAERRIKTIRWVVGTPGGVRGATWRLWSNKKGDFYLAARTLGGIVKASLHRDGRCSFGFTSEYYPSVAEKDATNTSRHLHRWRLADAPAALGVQVVTPASELRSYSPVDAPQTIWVPPPTDIGIATTSLFVTAADMNLTCSTTSAAPVMLGNLPTDTRTAWLFHANGLMDVATREWIQQQRSALAKLPGFASTAQSYERRVILGGDKGPYAQYLLDLAWSEPKSPAG